MSLSTYSCNAKDLIISVLSLYFQSLHRRHADELGQARTNWGQKDQFNRVRAIQTTLGMLVVGTGHSAAACERRRLSVAVIDDDVIQGKLLMQQFAKLGAAVTTFASGLDFLNKGCPQEKEGDW
jgi:hypothetical protein